MTSQTHIKQEGQPEETRAGSLGGEEVQVPPLSSWQVLQGQGPAGEAPKVPPEAHLRVPRMQGQVPHEGAVEPALQAARRKQGPQVWRGLKSFYS